MSVPGDNPAIPPSDPAPNPCLDGDAAWSEADRLAHVWARGFLRNKDLAADTAQDALLLLKKNAHNIHANWKAWLHRVVSRLASRKRRAECAEKSRHDSAPDTLATLPAKLSWAHERMVERENWEECSRFLDQLDLKFGLHTRTIVDLRGRGMRWEAIVKATGLKDSTCRRRFRIAKEWIKKRPSLQPAKGGHHE